MHSCSLIVKYLFALGGRQSVSAILRLYMKLSYIHVGLSQGVCEGLKLATLGRWLDKHQLKQKDFTFTTHRNYLYVPGILLFLYSYDIASDISADFCFVFL